MGTSTINGHAQLSEGMYERIRENPGKEHVREENCRKKSVGASFSSTRVDSIERV